MSKLNIIKQTLSKVAGIEVDITVRGDNKFTFSFEGENKKALKSIFDYFGDKLIVEKDNDSVDFYDKEIDMTYIYCSFKK